MSGDEDVDYIEEWTPGECKSVNYLASSKESPVVLELFTSLFDVLNH